MLTEERINKRIENIRLYDAYGFKRDISFEYDKNTSFEVFIYYRQAGDSGLYCFYDKLYLKDLDYIRKHQISGIYKLDCEVFYKQVMSKILYKYGKLRQGLELVIVNKSVLYEVDKDKIFVDVLDDYSKNFRYEKDLDSFKNHDYLDEVIPFGNYSFTKEFPKEPLNIY